MFFWVVTDVNMKGCQSGNGEWKNKIVIAEDSINKCLLCTW